MRRTSYTFTAYSYDDETEDRSTTTVEFDLSDEDLNEVCEKFAQFLNGAGFQYVTDVEWHTGDSSEPDTSLDWSSEQPELDFGQPLTPNLWGWSPLTPNVSSNITLSYGDIDVGYAGVAGGDTFSSYSITPEQVNVTAKPRNSIDDITPEEWDMINRK